MFRFLFKYLLEPWAILIYFGDSTLQLPEKFQTFNETISEETSTATNLQNVLCRQMTQYGITYPPDCAVYGQTQKPKTEPSTYGAHQ